jgi:hypothetical protein
MGKKPSVIKITILNRRRYIRKLERHILWHKKNLIKKHAYVAELERALAALKTGAKEFDERKYFKI